MDYTIGRRAAAVRSAALLVAVVAGLTFLTALAHLDLLRLAAAALALLLAGSTAPWVVARVRSDVQRRLEREDAVVTSPLRGLPGSQPTLVRPWPSLSAFARSLLPRYLVLHGLLWVVVVVVIVLVSGSMIALLGLAVFASYGAVIALAHWFAWSLRRTGNSAVWRLGLRTVRFDTNQISSRLIDEASGLTHALYIFVVDANGAALGWDRFDRWPVGSLGSFLAAIGQPMPAVEVMSARRFWRQRPRRASRRHARHLPTSQI
jgi:hypothetical protein